MLGLCDTWPETETQLALRHPTRTSCEKCSCKCRALSVTIATFSVSYRIFELAKLCCRVAHFLTDMQVDMLQQQAVQAGKTQ